MCTRLSVLVLAAVVLGLSGVASAAEITWTGPGTDWCEASNWSGGVEPNESDVARFVAPSPIVIQGPGCDANVGWMHGPAFNSSGTQVIDIIDAHVVVQYDWYMMQEHGVSGPNSTVNISGSSVVEILNQGGGLAMRGQDQGITNLNILSTGSGDPCFVANGTIAGADGTNAEFHLYMNGGYFEAGGLSFGDDGGGTFTMTGGTMILGGSGIRMASRAGNVPVQFIMDGDAYIETTGAFGCPTEEAGTGDVFLNSGTLICGGFSSSGFNWTLDIDADATWKIQGDRLVQIQGFIDLGLITGKDNTETPKAVYDGEYTWVGFNLLQKKAFAPSPGAGTSGLCPEPGVTLSWSAGAKAERHELFFGTDSAVVEAMTTPTALKALGDESYDTGTLEYGKAYYWRVDEVNDSDPCTWKGSVWSFSTENGKASDPSPFDGKRGIAPGPVYLRWTPPCYVTAQTLHYGTTFPQDGTWTSVALGASDDEYQLTVGQFEHYYWRVDTTAGALGVITGDTWDFTTGVGGVLMYYKFDGTGSFPSTITDDSGRGVQFTKDLSGGGTLSYGESNPGMDTSTASAYFDANVGLYRNDTGETDVLRLSGSEYTIEMWTKAESWTDGSGVFLISKRGSWGLEIHTDNDFEFRFQGGGGDTGNDSVTLDEWYHVAVIYDQADEELSGLYLDGIKEDGSGGLLPPDNNNPIWIGVDQRSDGSFRGHFDGLIDDLRIHDVALSTCALLTTSKEPGYPICPWPEDGGQDINPDGVVLSWSAGEGATSHVVYFGTEQADVENLDISTYLDEYSFAVSDSLDLEYGTTYYWRVVEQPGGQEGEVWRFTTEFLVDDENLRLHYKLDESSGETAYDSSGYGNHGDLDERGDGWRPSDGQSGGSFSFDDDNRIDAPDFATSTLASTVSISCWLKDSFSPGADNFVFGIGTGPYQIRATVPSSDGRSVEWRAGNDSNDVLVWDMFLDSIDPRTLSDWHHWVFVKDEGIGMQIYFDGELVDSNDVVNTTVIRLRSSELSVGAGSGHDSDLVGKVDDFRLYDIALDADQVSGLFRGGELELAWSPSPRSGAADVDQDVLLSWRPGDYAIEHDVYVGETYSEVADANTATVGIYKGRQLDMNYPLGASLSLGSIRYWRIDEVNDFDVNSPWKGKVWKFTVADYVTIDDMESYDPFVNRIWQKWDNPWGTGSFVDLGQAPFTPVNRGGNSMEYLYDNFIKWDFFSYWSEVEYNFDSSRNWTDAGVKLMTLFFYGDPTNAVGVTEQLSVGVAGTSTRVDVDLADMNDLLEEEWHEWNIELAEFAAAPLTAVDTVFLRFGDSSNTDTPGGEGVVYFDDIRLYPPKCVPEFGPVYDFSGDCLVGLAELRMLGEEWLLQDMLIATVTAPDPCVLHYAFDESSGSTVADSAGSYTGSVFDDVDQTPADITARMDAGMSGNSLHFSAPLGYMGISVPNDVFVDNGISDEITVAVWLKNAYPSESPDGGAFMWEFREWDGAATIGGDRVLAVETTDDGDTYTLHDSSRWVSYGLNWPGQTEWTHYAFVRDASNLSIYVNGLLEAVAASSGGAMATPGLLYVGISADLAPGNAGGLHDGFTGNMEDFMIFDYALSDDEAGYLGTQGTGYIPMQPATMNLVNDEPDGQKVVNFRDYAELTLYWLDEILWPE